MKTFVAAKQPVGLAPRGQAPAAPDSSASPGSDRVPVAGCPLPQAVWGGGSVPHTESQGRGRVYPRSATPRPSSDTPDTRLGPQVKATQEVCTPPASPWPGPQRGGLARFARGPCGAASLPPRGSSLLGTTAPTLMGETEAGRGRFTGPAGRRRAGLGPRRLALQAHAPRGHWTPPLGREHGTLSVSRGTMESSRSQLRPCERVSPRRVPHRVTDGTSRNAGWLGAGEAPLP